MILNSLERQHLSANLVFYLFFFLMQEKQVLGNVYCWGGYLGPLYSVVECAQPEF